MPMFFIKFQTFKNSFGGIERARERQSGGEMVRVCVRVCEWGLARMPGRAPSLLKNDRDQEQWNRGMAQNSQQFKTLPEDHETVSCTWWKLIGQPANIKWHHGSMCAGIEFNRINK